MPAPKQVDDLVYQIHECGVNLNANAIYLFGTEARVEGLDGEIEEPGVEYMMANKFIKNLHLCQQTNAQQKLTIHMKTCGGDWSEGMAIYDAIASYPWVVEIINYTHASSMSSIILQAADIRTMMPTSYFMFHEGFIGFDGSVKEASSNYSFFNPRTTKQMLEIYKTSMKETRHSKFSAWSEDRILKWLIAQMEKKADVYLDAQQTVEHGLADKVYGRE